MLDPNRYSLDAATVGFRKRMGLEVPMEAFAMSLQQQSDTVKVRREMKETPVSEVHVMGGQRFGIAGNDKTNTRLRQMRQMNGYPLRSFSVEQGPIVLPYKKQDPVMATPNTLGLRQYTRFNAVVGQFYNTGVAEPIVDHITSENPLVRQNMLMGMERSHQEMQQNVGAWQQKKLEGVQNVVEEAINARERIAGKKKRKVDRAYHERGEARQVGKLSKTRIAAAEREAERIRRRRYAESGEGAYPEAPEIDFVDSRDQSQELGEHIGPGEEEDNNYYTPPSFDITYVPSQSINPHAERAGQEAIQQSDARNIDIKALLAESQNTIERSYMLSEDALATRIAMNMRNAHLRESISAELVNNSDQGGFNDKQVLVNSLKMVSPGLAVVPFTPPKEVSNTEQGQRQQDNMQTLEYLYKTPGSIEKTVPRSYMRTGSKAPQTAVKATTLDLLSPQEAMRGLSQKPNVQAIVERQATPGIYPKNVARSSRAQKIAEQKFANPPPISPQEIREVSYTKYGIRSQKRLASMTLENPQGTYFY